MAEMSGMGWLPDLPDLRDYTVVHQAIAGMFEENRKKHSLRQSLALPATVDLRGWCSPVEDQLHLGSCTANAAVGIYEYFEKHAFGKYTDASRLFIYKTTRNLLGLSGDTGAYIRTTMAALVLFGSPPEKYWPYTDASPDFDKEPDAFHYAFAQNFQALTYYRLDPLGTPPLTFLAAIKKFLEAGYVSMIGFTVYDSRSQAAATGKIPFPAPRDRVAGGHAILLVGYDDGMKIKNTNPGGIETTGALLFKNSWGTGWGAAGYGWLPYEYVLKGLARDCWSMLKGEWVETGQFGIPQG